MLVDIFFEIDNFCKFIEQDQNIRLLSSGKLIRKKPCMITASEVLVIAVLYHSSGYATFKHYYIKHVQQFLVKEFPNLPSYNRFVELKNKLAPLMFCLMKIAKLGQCTGISYIDSFPLRVCHNLRIYSHKTFPSAAKGKSSTGWFYGFKLHTIINDKGEIIAFDVTPANVSDNNKNLLERLAEGLSGKIYGDKGYMLNQENWKEFYEKQISFITKIRKNMKNKLMDEMDKLLLGKRYLIETVGGILKESLNLEHARHRSIFGFLSHVFGSIIAYSFREKKPHLKHFNDEVVFVS